MHDLLIAYQFHRTWHASWFHSWWLVTLGFCFLEPERGYICPTVLLEHPTITSISVLQTGALKTLFFLQLATAVHDQFLTTGHRHNFAVKGKKTDLKIIPPILNRSQVSAKWCKILHSEHFLVLHSHFEILFSWTKNLCNAVLLWKILIFSPRL